MLNACSLINKIDELITIVQTYKPHIVAITETWLHDQINDAEIAINDHLIFRKDRGGGAMELPQAKHCQAHCLGGRTKLERNY